MNPHLCAVLESIKNGTFGNPEEYAALLDTITAGGDYYLLSHDFESCK